MRHKPPDDTKSPRGGRRNRGRSAVAESGANRYVRTERNASRGNVGGRGPTGNRGVGANRPGPRGGDVGARTGDRNTRTSRGGGRDIPGTVRGPRGGGRDI